MAQDLFVLLSLCRFAHVKRQVQHHCSDDELFGIRRYVRSLHFPESARLSSHWVGHRHAQTKAERKNSGEHSSVPQQSGANVHAVIQLLKEEAVHDQQFDVLGREARSATQAEAKSARSAVALCPVASYERIRKSLLQNPEFARNQQFFSTNHVAFLVS